MDINVSRQAVVTYDTLISMYIALRDDPSFMASAAAAAENVLSQEK
jgi:hypothetical protein